jgi:predicted MFS family arabinose efflux permease
LGSIANLLFKPYGFSDVQIGLCAIVMLIMGVLGSIAFSVYIKKTNNYKRAIRSIVAFSLIAMSFLFVWLNISAGIAMTLILIGIMGFVCTPVIAICYDLGC